MAAYRIRVPIFKKLGRTVQLTTPQRAAFLKAIQQQPKNEKRSKNNQKCHPVLKQLRKHDIQPKEVLHIWDSFSKRNNMSTDSAFNMVAGLSLRAAAQLGNFEIASKILATVESNPHANRIPFKLFSMALCENGAFRPAYSVVNRMYDLGLHNPSLYYPFFSHCAELRQPLMIVNILRKIFRTGNKKRRISPINHALKAILTIAERFSGFRHSKIPQLGEETSEEAEKRRFEEDMAIEELIDPYLEFADDIIDVLRFSNIANENEGIALTLPNATTFKLLLDSKWCISIDRVDHVVRLLKEFKVTVSDQIAAHVVRAVASTEPKLMRFYLNNIHPTPPKKLEDPNYPRISLDYFHFTPKKFPMHHESARIRRITLKKKKKSETKQERTLKQHKKKHRQRRLMIEDSGLRLMALGVLGHETYTALIEGLANSCVKIRMGHMSPTRNSSAQITAAILAWSEMHQQWMSPNNRTLLRLLVGCGAARKPELLWDTWAHLPNRAKYHPALLKGCFLLIGGADSAHRDSSHLMSCLKILKASESIKDGQPATIYTYNLLLRYLADASQLGLALDVLDQLEAKAMHSPSSSEGSSHSTIFVNEGTYVSLINNAGEARMNWRLEILYRMLQQGISPSKKTIDALTRVAIRMRFRKAWNMKMLDDKTLKVGNITITFEPRPLGIGYEGNTVVHVQGNSQARLAGVQIGWQIVSINGDDQPNNENIINQTIEHAKECNKQINMVFFKNDGELKIRNSIEDAIKIIVSSMREGGIDHPISLIGTGLDSIICKEKITSRE